MVNTIDFGTDARALAAAAALMSKHGVQRSSALPILGTVKLTQDGDRLTLEATDLRHAARLRVDGWGAAAPSAAVCVNAESLAGLAGKLTDVGKVALRFQGQADGAALTGRLRISGGTSGADLPVLAAIDFPSVNWDSDAESALTIDGGELKRLLGVGGAAVAPEDNRPALGGVRLAREGSALRAMSADGFRAVWAETMAVHGLALGLVDEGLIIHRDSVKALGAFVSDGQQVRLSRPIGQTGRLIAESVDGAWALALALVDGAYPDIARVWPDGDKAAVTCDPASLRRALGFMGAAQPSGVTPQVRVTVSSQEGVTLSTNATPEWVAATTALRAVLSPGFSGSAVTTLNTRLFGGLIDAFASAGAEDVTIGILPDKPTYPVTIDCQVTDTLTASACLMPMHLAG